MALLTAIRSATKNVGPTTASKALAEAIEQLILDIVALSNDDVESRWKRLLKRAKAIKRNAIACANEPQANASWFLQGFCDINLQYLKAWAQLKANQFYVAWVTLERIEINCATLFRNKDLAPKGIDQSAIASQVNEWQKLFPYKIFGSPEMVVGRYECSICGLSTGPWSSCTHRRGQVYMGQECYHIARDVKMVGISLVHDPVEKSSVVAPPGNDHSSYDPIRFVRDRLMSPRDRFTSIKSTTYYPHERFVNVAPTSPCPCNSGSPYEHCCLNKPGVVRPHLEVDFSKPIRADLPMSILSDDTSD